MDLGIAGKNALITGGSRGIGRATAWALASGSSAKPGFAIDEHWASPTVSERLEDPSHARTVGSVPVRMPLSVRLPSL